jgi:N-glycosylase/DNA lyase
MEACQGKTSDWRDLHAPPEQLRLAPTLLSGMSFRWRVTPADTFIGVLGDRIYELRETAAGAEYRTHGAAPRDDDVDAARELLRRHLSLDRGPREPAAGSEGAWAAIGASVSSGTEPSAVAAHHGRCAAVLPGVRVLTIGTPLEALVTFMGSANNSIKRNMQVRVYAYHRRRARSPPACCTSAAHSYAQRCGCILCGRLTWLKRREVCHAGFRSRSCLP